MTCEVQTTASKFTALKPYNPFESAWVRQHGAQLLIPVVLALGLLLWEGLVRWQDYPPFILPGPGLVWRKFDRSWVRTWPGADERLPDGLCVGQVPACRTVGRPLPGGQPKCADCGYRAVVGHLVWQWVNE